jgi:AraC family transcriptional regulator
MFMSVLGLGQSFGRASRQWYGESLVLTPVTHDQQRVNVPHAHEAAFVTMMLDGEYAETAASRSFRFERFTTVYHPPGMEHQDFVGRPGVRLLMFEFRPDLTADLGNQRAALASVRDLSGSRAAFELLSLYRGAVSADDALEFEARSLELVARLVAAPSLRSRDLPSLSRARDYLHQHYQDVVTMRDVAGAAGVHPVYLGQMFRRETGETVGEYVTRLRVRAAAEQLSSSETPLAVVAFEHGFCDQSHFQRAFKRVSGCTPAEFRRAFGATLRR